MLHIANHRLGVRDNHLHFLIGIVNDLDRLVGFLYGLFDLYERFIYVLNCLFNRGDQLVQDRKFVRLDDGVFVKGIRRNMDKKRNRCQDLLGFIVPQFDFGADVAGNIEDIRRHFIKNLVPGNGAGKLFDDTGSVRSCTKEPSHRSFRQLVEFSFVSKMKTNRAGVHVAAVGRYDDMFGAIPQIDKNIGIYFL